MKQIKIRIRLQEILLLYFCSLLALSSALTSAVSADTVSVGIPVTKKLHAETSFRWQDARDKTGKSRSLAVGNKTLPISVRGQGVATSGRRDIPLPATIVSTTIGPVAAIELDVEDYLLGVVGKEMPPAWPIEALKAQAIVARTYTFHRLRGPKKHQHVDLVATTADQVYAWQPTPHPNVQQAVQTTADQILLLDGQVADAFFHSCCGGHTAHTSEIWSQYTPGISAISDDYCSLCPDYFWSYEVSPKALGKPFNLSRIVEVQVTERGPSERITKVSLVDEDGSTAMATGSQLRKHLGAMNLKSTRFEISARAEAWLFQGSGLGHGVGLCQWGAKYMAESGYSYQDILAHYFPEFTIGDKS